MYIELLDRLKSSVGAPGGGGGGGVGVGVGVGVGAGVGLGPPIGGVVRPEGATADSMNRLVMTALGYS